MEPIPSWKSTRLVNITGLNTIRVCQSLKLLSIFSFQEQPMSTQNLLEAITRALPFLSNSVREAFRRVDRALFVPHYYQHQGAEWIREPSSSVVYEDKALTTQVVHALPSSSSSQPSVMALMLDALDVQPGHRVLEIG